jgi:hypothetical protein
MKKTFLTLIIVLVAMICFTSCETPKEPNIGKNFDGIVIQVDTVDEIFVIYYKDTTTLRTWKETYSIVYDDALVCDKEFLLERKIIIDRTNF